MSNSSGKDALGREEIKSMLESSEAFPHFEFSWFQEIDAGQPPLNIPSSAWQDHVCSLINLLQAVGCSMGF